MQPRQKYVGHVLSWEAKSAFGKHVEIPHPVYFHCYADNLEEATSRLSIQISRQGYGLGGIQDVVPVPTLKPHRPSRQSRSVKEVEPTLEDLLSQIAQLEQELSTQEVK